MLLNCSTTIGHQFRKSFHNILNQHRLPDGDVENETCISWKSDEASGTGYCQSCYL